MLPFAEELAARVDTQRRQQHEEALLEASAHVIRGQFRAQEATARAQTQASARLREIIRPSRPPKPKVDDPKVDDPRGEAGQEPAPEPKKPTQVLVRLKISPPDATILIGGRRYSRAEVYSGIRLPAKLVRYTLQHEAYRDLRGALTPHLTGSDFYETTLTMNKLKPARLEVVCPDDPNASVVIFDENRRQLAAGRVNQTFSIPVQDPISLKRKVGVQILPGPRGGRPVFNRMNMSAGKQERINVSMRP
jgi:hypothetical protein